jgi:exodeoxyribonuclease V alpha subunit
MMDLSLFQSVMAARARGCHALFVGDVYQLPPVGNGAPLRDLINSGCVGYGELTEIKRNSGGIVEACAAIRDGQSWSAGDNLIVTSVNSKAVMPSLLSSLEDLRQQGFDPVWDCQVLVAVNEKSDLCRKKVNSELQEILNPNPSVRGSRFRVGDKVVCLKNGYFTAISANEESDAGEDVYVANGELARVTEIEAKSFIASLSNPDRLIRVPAAKNQEELSDSDSEGKGAVGSWDLAYGLSTHKAQGSEWPVCIVVIDDYPGAKMVCSREWIYTAISRGKQRVECIGLKRVADSMCKRIAIGRRQTLLRQRIQLGRTNRELEDLLR